MIKDEERAPFSGTESPFDSLLVLAEGNTGAATVLAKVMQGKIIDLLDVLLYLYDKNIRGVQIWVLYKDICKEDLSCFVNRLKQMDDETITKLNEICTDNVAVSGKYINNNDRYTIIDGDKIIAIPSQGYC